MAREPQATRGSGPVLAVELGAQINRSGARPDRACERLGPQAGGDGARSFPAAWLNLVAIARVHACRGLCLCSDGRYHPGWRTTCSASPTGIRNRPPCFCGRRCGESAGTRNIAARLLPPTLSSSTWRLRSRRSSVCRACVGGTRLDIWGSRHLPG